SFTNTSTGDSLITYQWFFGSDSTADTSINPVHYFSPCDTYQVTLIAKDSSGASDTASQSIVIHCPPQAAFTFTQSSFCDSATLAFTNTSFSEDEVAGWQWNFGDGDSSELANPVHFYDTAGIYIASFTLTTVNGCTGTFSDSVLIHASPSAAFTFTGSAGCPGDTVTFSDASISDDPVAEWLYTFGDAASGANDSSFAQVASHVFSSPGDFAVTLKVTTVFGCTDVMTQMISVKPAPSADAGADATICKGDSVQLQAGGGVSYLWNPDSALTNDSVSGPLAFPSSTTHYYVTVTDSSGCSAIDSVTVFVNGVNADAGNDTSICSGDTAMLHASAGISFLWQPGASLSSDSIQNPIAFPLQTTVYTVTVIDSSGCSQNDTVTVMVHLPEAVEITGLAPDYCGNNPVITLTANPEGGIFSGSGVTGNQIDPSSLPPENAYSVIYTFTDSIGCTGADTAEVFIHSIPAITATGDTSICFGDTAQLNVTGGETYSWQPAFFVSADSISNPVAFPFSTTVFIVEGSDSNGCSVMDSVTVTILNSIPVNAGNDTMICDGTNAMLHGSGADSYSWSPGNFLNDSTIANPIAFLTSATTFILTGTAGNCSRKDSVNVTVNLIPVVSAGNDTTVCFGSSVQLHAAGALNYQWQPGISLSDSAIADPVASPLTSVTYTVTGSDSIGCAAADDVTVVVYALPQIFIFADPSICFGDTIPIYATGANTFQWQPVTGLSAPDNNSTLAFPEVTTTYTAFGTDVHGCTGFADSTIVVFPLPEIVVTDDQTVCPGIPVQLSASGGNIYSWQPSQGLDDDSISNPVATVNASITYTVTVTNENFCTARDSVVLTLVPSLMATASDDIIICKGTSAQLFADGGQTYLWLPSASLNDGNIHDPVASPDSTTTYTLYVSDGACYTDTFSVKVTVQDQPVINAGPDLNVISGSSTQLMVTGTGGAYQWMPEEGLDCATCLSPVATPQQTTTFTVTVTDSAGCKASDEVVITVACGDDVVFVPDAFTPNDNGHNDVFLVRALGNLTLHYFRVYDRWGKIIFESHDFDYGWDGTYHDKPMMPGAYLYEFEVNCENGIEVRKQGNVTLLR
ncbi:MAG: PKD domain-containing protein, partial [Chitinophagales bacterium]